MNEPTRRSLGSLELRCPPLPQTLREALDLIDRPEKMEVGPVTEMVQRDPVVVARLLHMVNSAYYGLRHTISSADRAVVMLGPVAVAGIVVGMHMLKLRSVLEGPANACFHRLIHHSIATAFLTRHLLEGTPRDQGSRRPSARIGVPFTSGLLHDFGKIILIYNFPENALNLYDSRALSAQVNGDERELEQLLFGCDHTEAGEFAARKLNFPDILVNIIRHHHRPLGETGDPDADRLIRATAAANEAAKAMGYPAGESLEPKALTLNPIWHELIQQDALPYPSPDALIEDVLLQQEYLDDYVNRLTAASTRTAESGDEPTHLRKV